MNFASDNTGPAHPRVMAALQAANDGFAMPYGAEAAMTRVRDQMREVFEAPEAAIYLVATGTAANSLILATLAQPWETIFCSDCSHVHEDECAAPEFFTGGSKLSLVPTRDGKMTPDALRAAIVREQTRGVHGPQRGPVTVTQATEKGTVHTLEELQGLTAVAREFELKTHMDGARFANALVRLGCSPAEMTWKVGIDAVSFGGTKNGLLGVEAVIFFDPAHAWEFELRRKRGAHLFSKHRFLSAQMSAYLEDGLWLDMARAANATCDVLARGLRQMPDTRLLHPPQANIIFAEWPRALHRRLHDAGAQYYLWNGDLEGPDADLLTARLVADWSGGDGAAEAFLAAMTSAQ